MNAIMIIKCVPSILKLSQYSEIVVTVSKESLVHDPPTNTNKQYLEEMFSQYYMHSDVNSRFTYSTSSSVYSPSPKG